MFTKKVNRIRPTIIMCHQSRRTKCMPCAIHFVKYLRRRAHLASYSISPRQRLHTGHAKRRLSRKVILKLNTFSCGPNAAINKEIHLPTTNCCSLLCHLPFHAGKHRKTNGWHIRHEWGFINGRKRRHSLSLFPCVTVCVRPQTHKRNLLEKPEVEHAY